MLRQRSLKAGRPDRQVPGPRIRPNLYSIACTVLVGLLAAAVPACKTSVSPLRGKAPGSQTAEPLELLSLDPAPGRIEVGPRREILASFSQDLDPATVTPDALAVTVTATGKPVPGATRFAATEPRSLRFAPTAGWPPEALVSVNLAPGLRSADGAPLGVSANPQAPRLPVAYSTFAEAPSLTGALELVEVTSSSAALRWGAASDNSSPDGSQLTYRIYGAAEGNPINYDAPAERETTAGTLADTVTRLEPDTAYHFAVRASDALGNLSAPSNEISARTLSTADRIPPSFAGVEKLEVDPARPTELGVSWQPAVDAPDPQAPVSYNLYVALEPGKQDFQIPALTTPAGATSATLTGLLPDTEYFVVVRAMDASGNEEQNTVEAPGPRRTPVSFSKNILPLLTLPAGYDPTLCWPACTSFRQPGGCARGGCHAGGAPAGGLRITSYADLAASPTIVPGDPARSEFVFLLRTTSARRMPRGGTCNLEVACIDRVARWIEQGAQDN